MSKIDEFVDQCTSEGREISDDYFDKDKFADLILKECLRIVEHRLNILDNMKLSEYNRGWVNGRMLASEQIRDMFGVK